ncbi:signal peptidase I [Streptomyces sp. NBC_00555]|uniref:signal peptidase I n=1 Tax=Streptomyces sp. NBC_00555 TaxID=2903662 RepID=UPI002253A129|nr:signal peptidase I [Streptomyces sp. NBC_00555]MCX5013629.1 signal peptidase I [Streptomyces sp. NBC_00555]
MERRRGRRRGIWAIVLLVTGGLLVLGGAFWGAVSAQHGEVVYDKKTIPSENMRPTYEPGDTGWFSMGTHGENFEVSRGDVVLVEIPEWVPDGPLLSRVVAIGGDRIEFRRGETTLRLNGQPLDEPYILDRSRPSSVPFDVTVPKGRIFLMGDNRMNSFDSSLHPDKDQGTLDVSTVIGEDVARPTDLLVAGGALVGGAVVFVVGGGLGIWALVLRRRRAEPVAPVWPAA